MSINLTESAAAEVRKYRDELNIDSEAFLRVGVAAGGCSGFDYRIEFDEKFDEAADSRFECFGVNVVIDKKSALLLDGTTIDFYEGLQQRGFKFENPNATRSCGCGKSFGV